MLKNVEVQGWHPDLVRWSGTARVLLNDATAVLVRRAGIIPFGLAHRWWQLVIWR